MNIFGCKAESRFIIEIVLPMAATPLGQRSAILLVAFLAMLPILVAGQADPTAVSNYRNGEQALLAGETEKAIRFFRQAVRTSPGFSSARRSLGLSLLLVQEFEEAARQLDAVLEADSMYSRTLYFQSGIAHYTSAHFDLALQRFLTYDSLLSLPAYLFGIQGEQEASLDSAYQKELPIRIEACKFSKESTFLAQGGTLSHLGKPINTPADEYFPFLSNDKEWMYFTRRKDPTQDEDLYVAQRKADNWAAGRQVLGGINTSSNEGMGTFVRNGQHMYFTACGRSNILGTCDLWRADLHQGEIVDFGPLGEILNSDSWDSQAAVSCDGSILYFSSYREGGYGGADLWWSTLTDDGTWSQPENMGPQINTEGDEEAPFISNDGKTLFFSSTGHPGYGESDIFVSWFSPDAQWTLPINLGAPVNSPHHELGFFLSADNKTAFISSDRPGGEGNMDIYQFDLPGPLLSEPITFVQGKVYDAVSLKPISTKIQIGEDRTVISDENGHFFLCVPADGTLDIRAWKRGYAVFQNFFLIPEHENKTAFAIPVALRPLGADLDAVKDTIDTEELVNDIATAFAPTQGREFQHNVYFDFNSSQLGTEQKDRLNQFMEGLPSGKILRLDIYGYTDTQGSVSYNKKLSEDRANQVGDYMRDHQLEVSFIKMKGVGEFREKTSEVKKRRVEIRIWIDEQ